METTPGAIFVNDIHSALNATRVARLIEPAGLEALVGIVQDARDAGAQLSLCDGRRAMGGRQFGTDSRDMERGQENIFANESKGSAGR